MTELSYDALLDRLFPRLTGGIRWGLERTHRLLGDLGDPHLSYPTIHVGGTNGKGSVAAMVASVLRHTGRAVGLYTSPHLVDFRERILIDGAPIGEAALLAAAREAWPSLEREAPSFFEATTVIAFHSMERAGVDVAVVEVGMGGRLDATNVVRPDVTVITNVALDHAQYLGDTLPAVAREKAGIIKPGVPVVTAEQDREVLAVLERKSEEEGAPLHVVAVPRSRSDRAGTRVELDTVWGTLSLRVPLAGPHQAKNLVVAVRALELLPEERRPDAAAVEAGLAATRWPGRLQVVRVAEADWVFDVAHNGAGVASLLAALPTLEPRAPVVAVVGVLGDKDWARMLPPLVERADQVILAEPPSAPAQRRWDPEAVLARLGNPEKARVVRPFTTAIREAVRVAGGGTVVCTGSVHTVGDAMRELGISPFGSTGLQVEGRRP